MIKGLLAQSWWGAFTFFGTLILAYLFATVLVVGVVGGAILALFAILGDM